MKKLIILNIIAWFGSLCGAMDGSIEIIGRGSVEKAPEFAELQIRVMSICYAKPTEAQNQNAHLSNQIVAILKGYVRTEKDQVIATGGHTIRQTEYTADDDGRSKVLCERKWRTTNTLILQTESMDSISQIQEKVLETVAAVEGVDVTSHEQTYAELGEPSFSVFPETYSLMKKEAQSKAWSDASSQFQVFLNQCKLENVKLAQISQPEYMRLAKSVPNPGGETAPIIPDAVSVFATWRFVWSFDPTPCYR